MRKALTHCCQCCDWQQTSMLGDGESMQQELFDHCPQCRSPHPLMRQATRLEALGAAAARSRRATTYQNHGKLPSNRGKFAI